MLRLLTVENPVGVRKLVSWQVGIPVQLTGISLESKENYGLCFLPLYFSYVPQGYPN